MKFLNQTSNINSLKTKLLILLLLNTFSIDSQTIDDISSIIKNITSYKSGRLNITGKRKFLFNTDTLLNEQNILFYKDSVGMSNIMFTNNNNLDTLVWYKGNYIYSNYKTKNVYNKKEISLNKTKLIKYIFYTSNKNYLLKLINDSLNKVEFLNSYTENNQDILIYKISFPDNEDFKNSYFMLHFNINKKNLYKVIYRVEYMDDFQYDETVIRIDSLYKNIDSEIKNIIVNKHNDLNKRTNIIIEQSNLQTINDTIKKAINWRLPLVYGDTLDYNNISSKLILLDFWYVSCYPCLKSIPDLTSIDSIYNESDLTIVGINAKDYDLSKIKKIIKKFNIEYNIVYDGGNLAKAYKVYGYPQFFLINTKTNEIVLHNEGFHINLENILIKEINNYLEK